MKVLRTALVGSAMVLLAGCATTQQGAPATADAARCRAQNLPEGCATTQQGASASARPGEGDTDTADLNLCVYTSKNELFGTDYVNRRKFADAKGEPSFQSVRDVSSLSETQGCDLMVELTLGSGTILPGVSNKSANVYSAYGDRQVPIKEYGLGRKPLMVAEATSADLFPGMDTTPHKLRRQVYSAFRKGTPLYAQVAAERDSARRQEADRMEAAQQQETAKMDAVRRQSVAEFGGLGIQIGLKDGKLAVIAPIEGTPAERAGIKPGDRIIKVNDESTVNMTLFDAVQRLRGLKGTTVTLTLVRDGAPEPIQVALVREIITKVEAKRDAPQREAAQKQGAEGVSKAETEKVKAEAEKTTAEVEKIRAETDKFRAEAEKAKAETERAKAETEKSKVVAKKDTGAARPVVPSDIDHPVFGEAQRALGEDDVAVVIGVEKYQDLPAADYAASDARLVKEYLVALGLRERNIQLLVDERAGLGAIKKTIESWLPNRIKKDGRVVVYYSGHGSPDPVTGAAYIVPHDGDPNYLADTGYPLKHLYEKLGALPAQEVVVLLDSCFSGTGGRSVLAKGARPMVVTKEGGVLPPKMVVLAATQGGQISTSSPEKGHGLFTYHVLKALKDGKKDTVEIYQHIQPLVEDEAKALGVQQSPSLNPEPRLAQVRFRLRN